MASLEDGLITVTQGKERVSDGSTRAESRQADMSEEYIAEDWGGYEPETQKALRFVSLLDQGAAKQIAGAIAREYVARKLPESARTKKLIPALDAELKAMLPEARKLIREWSKPTRDNFHNKWWEGIAPSYLCTELGVAYDDACAILLELQAKGFIYDNGNGNYHKLEDGRTCATRFFIMSR